ncbi:hypothetical protein [Kribbella deserti]|uniref:Fibronectin type-III domain-containing protein n=1 Tax=Kribbella deserti TaxID=1926257 RepID=A0ABV6QTK9_9ACTN
MALGTFRRPWSLPALVAIVVPVLCVAGCSTEPSPTSVTVAWSDASRRGITVSWAEPSDVPNKVSIEGVVTASPSYLKYTKAGEPNTVTLPRSAFPVDGNFRIAVTHGTPSSGSLSKPGHSPMFDTDGPVEPVVTGVTRSGNAVLVRWRAGSRTVDYTPGDPLDLPAGRQLFSPAVGQAGKALRILGRNTSATQRLITNVRPPYRFQVMAANEWGTTWGAVVTADTTAIKAQIPGTAAYGASTLVRGQVTQNRLVCQTSKCGVQPVPAEAGILVVLHARDRMSAPWRAVGRTRTKPGGFYFISVPSPGTRMYRAVAPTSIRSAAQVAVGSTSTAKVTRTRVRLIAAGFAGGNVKRRGQAALAMVSFAPAINGRAMLQYWNGRAWSNAGWVPVRAGRAVKQFGATRPGVAGYRYVIPPLVHAGRPIEGVATGSFVLRTF